MKFDYYKLKQSLIIVICLFQITQAGADQMYPFYSHLQQEQFNTLTKQIRCVVCQNQTIADSNALMATVLRNKIYQMILQKKSDEEIKEYLVARYGQFILLQPNWDKQTFVLWLFPWGALFLTFIVFIKRRLKSSIPGAGRRLSPEPETRD